MSYGVFSQYYDRLMTDADYPGKARFIVDILESIKPGCSLVVDLACGTGSLSAQLSALGYDMIGVDQSVEMLSAAREKSPAQLFLCQSMQKLDLYGTVDAVVCALDSVNHVTDPAALERAFSRVALFLEPDGVFIFDANTPYKHASILADNAFVYDLGDLFCCWQNSTDGAMTTISLDFFERDGDAYYRSSESFRERAYSREELADMLSRAGLRIEREYDDYTLSPVSATTQRAVYVCRKTSCPASQLA